MRRRRFGQGRIYEASGKFYVQYRTTIVGEDGLPKRVQRSEYLCDKDDVENRSIGSASVVNKCAEVMLKVNQEKASGRILQQPVSVVKFYEDTYLPFIKSNLREATVHGYEKIWSQHLKQHFGEMVLSQYRTHIASDFLTSKAGPKGLGRRTLAHIRSLASAIFTHAVNKGFIETNPWHDAKVLGKVKEPRGTAHYTLDQALKMIAALVGHTDCQAVLSLSCFLGLRPGEIRGLQWSDIEAEWIHIRRAVVRGIVGETKTRLKAAADQLCSCGLPVASCQRLPLFAPVSNYLKAWREDSGNPSSGWVFPNRMGKPIDMDSLARQTIKPILESKKIQYKGLYPGRRGAATILTELTGSAIAAQQLLRHQDLAVTTKNYVQMMPDALIAGVKLLEQKLLTAPAAGGV